MYWSNGHLNQYTEKMFLNIFKSPTWYGLNLGKITEKEVIYVVMWDGKTPSSLDEYFSI